MVRLHDQSIFLCLLFEIRASAFLRARYADVEYIRARLEDRTGGATEISDDEWYDEFERYSHPEFQNAITKLRKSYERFYGKGQGSEVVDILGGVPSPIESERGEALAKGEAIRNRARRGHSEGLLIAVYAIWSSWALRVARAVSRLSR
jgi:hypothetical protein